MANDPTNDDTRSEPHRPSQEEAASPELPVRLDQSGALDRLSNRYEVGAVLGTGGMGTVLACRDTQIGRDIAIKRLDAAQGSARARFVREARLQGQLEHPAVPPVYELGVDADGKAAFTMKRVRGVTLRKVLSRLKWYPERYAETYSERRLLSAFSRVCLAVDYAHQRGVLHRDLKPGNLMWGEFGEVTVIDWGLARLLGERDVTATESDAASLPPADRDVTRFGDVLGTPGYASPEQLEDPTGALTPASDVYALGAILFEILTLQALHDSSADQAIVDTRAGIVASPRARRPGLNVAPELDALCIQSTLRDPSARPSPRALHEAIERHLDGQRDREQRQTLAAQHIARATELVAQAAGVGSLDARKAALRELGSALAIDPGSNAALTELARLMSVPLKALPDEVTEALERARVHRVQRGGVGAAIAYVSLFLYLPLIIWAGVRAPAPIIALYALNTMSAIGVGAVSRSRTAPGIAVVLCMLLSTLAFSFTAALYGALVLMPALIAVNTTAYTLVLERKHRALAITAGVLGVLIPALLEVGGFGGVRYVFDAAGMHIASGAIELARAPSYVLLIVASLASVITGALSTANLRDSLTQAELQLQVSAWQLKQLSARDG